MSRRGRDGRSQDDARHDCLGASANAQKSSTGSMVTVFESRTAAVVSRDRTVTATQTGEGSETQARFLNEVHVQVAAVHQVEVLMSRSRTDARYRFVKQAAEDFVQNPGMAHSARQICNDASCRGVISGWKKMSSAQRKSENAKLASQKRAQMKKVTSLLLATNRHVGLETTREYLTRICAEGKSILIRKQEFLHHVCRHLSRHRVYTVRRRCPYVHSPDVRVRRFWQRSRNRGSKTWCCIYTTSIRPSGMRHRSYDIEQSVWKKSHRRQPILLIRMIDTSSRWRH